MELPHALITLKLPGVVLSVGSMVTGITMRGTCLCWCAWCWRCVHVAVIVCSVCGGTVLHTLQGVMLFCTLFGMPLSI